MMMNKMSKRHTIMKSLFATIASVLMLAAASLAQAQPFAYIPNNGSNNVSVINTVTNIVVATVPVGSLPVGVAVNPGGARVYITNSSGNSVSVIDTATNTVTATVPVGAFPQGVALNPAGTRVYVANNVAGNVSVIDATNNTVVATVTVGTSPVGVAVNPAGTRAYVTNSSASVSVIDTTNNTVVATIPLANSPGGIAVNPAGTRAYVPISNINTVAVIDTTNNTVLTTVAVGQAPRAVAVNPAGTLVYVANSGGTIVSVINTSTNTVVATVPVGTAPRGVAINPAGTRAYVANQGSSSVSVIDTATNTVVATVPVGASPIALGQFVGGPVPTVPGAPTAATAVAGDASATVSYTPPAFNGGSTITTYTATSNPPGIQGFATGGPIIVNGLTNGTAYTFTVTATNGVGVGPPSAPSNSVTPAAALVACQFIPTSGAWIVPANWSNCASGNGVPAGTPGTANRADILGKTATLPTGTLNVGDINLSGTAVIQGTGLSTSTLNVVAAGSTAWGIGSYTFQNMTVVFTGSFPVDARNGLLSVNNSVLVVSTPSSGIAAGAVTITGVGAKISNGGVFLLNTSLTMTAGGAFENNSGASFSPQAPITVNGSFVNQGAFVTQAGFPITLANAAAFSQPAASGFIAGDGIIAAIGQVLTVANGLIVGSATFNVGTLSNTGAVVAPTSLGMIGTVTVNGNYVSGPAASVNIKIAAGMPSPVSDQLVVSGTSTLTNGIANFAYIDAGFGPYVPVQGNTFNFITAAATAGTFSSFTFPPSGNVVSLTYTPTVVQFVVGAPVAPAITVAGTTTFPSTAVGASSGVQAITITNSGTGTLTLNSITHSNASVFPDTLGGPAPNATHYCGFGSLAGGVPNTGVPINIAPAASCVLNLIFSPNAVGALTGTITVNSNAPTSPTAIALSGTGLAASAPSMTVAFAPATVAVNTNAALTLTLTNPAASSAFIGSGSVTIPAGLTATPPGSNTCGTFGSVGGGVYSFGMGFIPAMGSCTIVLTVQSATPGGYAVSVAPGALNAGGANTNTSAATLTVTAAPVGPFAYVPNFGSFSGTTVSVIDTATNTVVATVTVGNGPVAAVVNAAGTRAYIANQQGNSVSVIDTATNTVVATVPVGSQPAGIAVNPAGTRLYAPNQTSNNLTVIDATTNTVITTVAGLAFPVGAVVNPSGSRVYVTTFSSNAVAVLDTATNAVIATIPVCASPFVPVINPTGTRVYVDCTSGTVSVIDTATNLVAATVPVGTNARGIAVNPAGTAVYVANNGSNTISVISTATNTVTATLPSPGGPLGGAFNPAGTRFYVANSSANSVSVFDTATNSLVATVPVGANPFGIGIVPAAVGPTPIVSLVPGALAFGTRTLSTTSPPSTVALGNAGTALLTITSITASGDYAFTTSCPLAPSTLAVGIACPINVTFTPLAVGARPGSITIVSNAPGSPHTIGLSGTGSGGAVPNVSLAPAALAFGTQTVNTASALRSVVVSNTGFANLLISSIGISAPFSRVPLGAAIPPDCGGSVAPGNSCQIGVIFSPASGGPLTGQISIIDNATGSPRTVGLSGTGVAVPVAVISASAVLAFGDQVINSAASVQNLIISNTGTATLNISAITLTGTNAANFTLTGQSGCVSVAPGGNCTLPVTFATTTVGARTAQVNITSNAQNAALVNTVSLTGNGILAPRPVVNVTATAIGYGNVIFGGATPNQIVTLTNSGGQAMNIPSIVVTGDFMQMNNCGTGLASLASCTISIIFAPLGQGVRFGELILTSSATSSPDRIQLSGTGCRWFSQAQSRLFLTSCGS